MKTQQGSVSVLMVGILPLAISILGLLVDTGRLIVDHIRLQGAADSCALALAIHPEWTEEQAQEIAAQLVTLNSAGQLQAIDRSSAPLMRCKANLSGWTVTLLSLVGVFTASLSAQASATLDSRSKTIRLVGGLS